MSLTETVQSAPRRVLVSDVLPADYPVAIMPVELVDSTDVMAAFDPARVDYDFVVDTLARFLGRIVIVDARTAVGS